MALGSLSKWHLVPRAREIWDGRSNYHGNFVARMKGKGRGEGEMMGVMVGMVVGDGEMEGKVMVEGKAGRWGDVMEARSVCWREGREGWGRMRGEGEYREGRIGKDERRGGGWGGFEDDWRNEDGEG